MSSKLLKSFSLVELILSVGIFVVFSFGALGYLLTGYTVTRKDEEYSVAEYHLQSGLDIVNFIKRDNWSSLADGRYGLSFDGSKWNLVLDHNELLDSKYTRVIDISSVYRDVNGNISSEAEGIVDPYSKRINLSLLWKLSNNMDQTLDRELLLTNWEKQVPSLNGGMMAYADFSGSDDVIKYKILNKNKTWSAEGVVPDFGVPDNRDTRRVEVYASPTRDEYILLTKHTENGQFIYANVWDGDSWGNSIRLAGYGDNTNPNSRNFDGAYLDNGDFLVVYDDFTFEPKYRKWNGSSWSSQSTVGNLGFLGYPVWIQVRAKPGSNDAIAVVRDALQHTTSFKWNNSSWGNKTLHGSSSSGFSLDNISIAWSRNNTNYLGMIFNEWPDNYPNIKIWNNSSSSWSSDVENLNVGGRSQLYEIADSPKADAFLGCIKNSNRTINCLRTSLNPPLWKDDNRVASNTNENEERSFSLAYESKSGELALLVYSEERTSEALKTPKYRIYNESLKSWGNEEELPGLNSPLSTVRVIDAPNSDDIFVMMGDESKYLTTVVWDGTANIFSGFLGYAFQRQASNGSDINDFWYSFAWAQYEK